MDAAVTLRAASAADECRLFDWANDPATRRSARNRQPIAWSEHRDWFAAKLAAADCAIWVAEVDGEAVGQVRLDRHDVSAEIDIAVAPQHRGHGYGQAMLCALAADHAMGATCLQAAVRMDNDASLAMFRNAGFAETSRADGFVNLEKRISNS
jgi:RimJ/RimL family protein N-acetyltransferase